MPITDGKMTAPLGVKAVANYFGVATDVFSACTAGAINKWAKHKPIALASMGLTDTPASLTAAQKKAANYGLTYKTAYATSKAYLPEKIAEVCGENGTWTYTKPVEGTDWARLDDFLNPVEEGAIVGYNAESAAPCESTDFHNGPKYDVTEPGDFYVTFVNGMASVSSGQLRLDDMGIYTSILYRCYLCLAFQSGTEWYYIFSSDTLGNMVTWDNTIPQASVPLITNPLFTPFQSIGEGGSKKFPARVFLIDLYGAFDGSVPSTYPGKCISQTSLASKAYNVYSLPLSDANMSQTVATLDMYWPKSATSLIYGYTVSAGSSSTIITVDVTNKTSAKATIQEIFVYLMADFTFNYGGAEGDVQAAQDAWLSSEHKETGGIYVDGTWGTGTYAAYGAAAVGAQTIAVGETKYFTITFPGIVDAFGHSYIDPSPVVYGCSKDTAGGLGTF